MQSLREAIGGCQELTPPPPPPPPQLKPQLNLPTGPTTALRGGRRERTDEDKAWYSEQLKVVDLEIANPYYREVYRDLAFLASCNTGRLSYAAHSTTATKKGVSVKTVQRAVKSFERDGLIRCLLVGAGREPGRYLIIGKGKNQSSMDSESTVHGLAVHQREEGREVQAKNLLSDGAHTLDPGDPVRPQKEIIKSLDPPSPEKARAPVQKTPEPTFQNPAQVAKLFKLQRKLGYQANDQQAIVFDDLEHPDKKRIIDRLESEEQLAAVRGEVAPPPKKPRAPRALVVERKPKAERPSCSVHEWTPPAEDGFRNCHNCDDEKKDGAP